MLKMRVLGSKQIADRLDHILHGKKSRFGQALEKVAVLVESNAKEIIYEGHEKHLEQGTGRLRASLTHKTDRAALRALVGTNVIYGRIHELGGKAGRNLASLIPARPYLGPALESQRANISKLFAYEIDKLLGGK